MGVVKIVEIKKRRKVVHSHSRSVHVARQAVASVVEVVKGTSTDTTLTIAFDYGVLCPNVTYDERATYLVFLQHIDKGLYLTIGYDYGRMAVHEGLVPGWHAGDTAGTPVPRVIAELRQQVAAE